MNQLIAGVIFYDDGPALFEKSLKALKANGMKIVAIDGVFQELLKLDSTLKPFSTDGCIDVAKSLADIYIPAPLDGWDHQWRKRNAYLQETPLGDFVCVVDADEILQPFKGPLNLTEDVSRIMERRTYLDGHSDYFSTTRVYKKYDDLAYQYRHCSIYRMKQHNPADYHSGCITTAKGSMNMTRPIVLDADRKEIFITHDYRDRPAKRWELKERFFKSRDENKYSLI